jgi:hypothetical protein
VFCFNVLCGPRHDVVLHVEPTQILQCYVEPMSFMYVLYSPHTPVHALYSPHTPVLSFRAPLTQHDTSTLHRFPATQSC